MLFIHHTHTALHAGNANPPALKPTRTFHCLRTYCACAQTSSSWTWKTEAAGRVNPRPRLGESLCRVQMIPYLAQEVLQAVSHDAFANLPICRANSTGPCPGGFPPGLRHQLLGHHCSAHCHMPGNTSLNIRRPACCLQVCPRLTLPTNQGCSRGFSQSPSEDTSPIWVGKKIRLTPVPLSGA